MSTKIDALYYELAMRDAQFQAAVARNEQLLARLEKTAARVDTGVGAMNASMQLAAGGTTRLGGAAERATSSLGGLRQLLQSLGVLLGARQLIEYADGWALVQGRLALVTGSTVELAAVTNKLFDLAQETRSEFGATADLYARLARSTKELGLSQSELVTITRAINEAFVVSGTSAGEAQAAIIQLGQALASGTLRGDELRSVLEQAPRLAQAIADSMGITIGQLRDLGAQGKLTSKQIATALLEQAGTINREFSKVPTTIGQAFTQVTNALKRFVGEAGQATGAGRTLAGVLKLVADNIGLIANAMLLFGLGRAAGMLTRLIGTISTLASEGRLFSTVLARLGGPVMAAATAGVAAINGVLAVSAANMKKAREEADKFKQSMRDLSPRELRAVIADLDTRIGSLTDIITGEARDRGGKPLTAGRVNELQQQLANLKRERQAIQELLDEQAQQAEQARRQDQARREAARAAAEEHAKALSPVRERIAQLQFDATEPDQLAKVRRELQQLLDEARRAGATAGELATFREQLAGIYELQKEKVGRTLIDQLEDEIASLTPTLADDLERQLDALRERVQQAMAQGLILPGSSEAATANRLIGIRQGLIPIQQQREALDALLDQIAAQPAGATLTQQAQLTFIEDALRTLRLTTHEKVLQQRIDELLLRIARERKQLAHGQSQDERDQTNEAKRQAEEAEKRREALRQQAQHIRDAAQGALELARSFGLVTAETERALRNISDIAAGIGPLIDAIKAGGLGAIASAALPVLGGLSGLVSSLFGESEAERRHREVVQQNTEAIRSLTQHIGDLAASSSTGRSIAAAREVLNAANLDVSEFAFRTRVGGKTGQDRAFEALARAGLTQQEVEELARSLGITLDGTAKAWRQFRDALNQADLSAFTDTFSGAMQRLRDSFEVYDITDPVERLRRTIRALGDARTGVPAIARAFQGLDVGLSEDRARAIERLQALFEQLATGQINPADLGAASLSEARQEVLDLIAALRDNTLEQGPSGTGGFNVERSITEVTGSRIAGLLTSANVWAQQTAENTAIIARALTGAAAPVPAPIVPSGAASGGLAPINVTINVTVPAGTPATSAGTIGDTVGSHVVDALDRALATRATQRRLSQGDVTIAV